MMLHIMVPTISIFLVLVCVYIEQRIDWKDTHMILKKYGQIWTEQFIPPNPVSPQPASSSLLHVYQNAAICSDSKICSDIGRNLLKHKGTAVDAAVATLLCKGLLAMQSMGLGGGTLMNIYVQKKQRAYSVLGRELAPPSSAAIRRKQTKAVQDEFLGLFQTLADDIAPSDKEKTQNIKEILKMFMLKRKHN